MLGVIGTSDKTPLTIGTGNKEMHPLLLSLANIEAGVRMKATSHAFALAAYLPIPKFLNVSAPIHAVLTARVYHICVSTITKNLKLAEAHGVIMSDPRGNLRMCHTPLAAWIADLPEQRTIACVLANQSATSTATSDEFDDSEPHPRRTREVTLNRISQACAVADPAFIPAFISACQPHGLNGVHQPFWKDWGNASPSDFITPDALHMMHKFFFDHPLKWVINIMGGNELDRRMAALQPRVGSRHWTNGISKLKQCTGREHRDLEKILIAVAAGAIPNDVLSALRALVEFIFQAQGLLIYDEHLHALREALREFHALKNSIIIAGGRLGRNGPILHFKIPKLEAMGGIAHSVVRMGASYQYTSDITERCHITHVKTPYRMSNHRNFHQQCCRYMDRVEKSHIFAIYTSLKANNISLLNEMFHEASEVSNHYPEAVWLSHALPHGEGTAGTSKSKSSLFNKSRSHLSDNHSIAFLVNLKPHYPQFGVSDAAKLFNLPDLRPALGDYFTLQLSDLARNGQRRCKSDCNLPFTRIHVWNNFRMQKYSTQDTRIVLPSRTVQALPPSAAMPLGRGDTVLVNTADGSGDTTSSSGGECESSLYI